MVRNIARGFANLFAQREYSMVGPVTFYTCHENTTDLESNIEPVTASKKEPANKTV